MTWGHEDDEDSVKDMVGAAEMWKDGERLGRVKGTLEHIADLAKELGADELRIDGEAFGIEPPKPEPRPTTPLLDMISAVAMLNPQMPRLKRSPPIPKRRRYPQSKNSPCACGSGRKFKKCCMEQQ